MLIFGPIEGAGAVDQLAAGADEANRGAQDLELAVGAAEDTLRGPFEAGFGIATEESFTGAGGIDDDAIENRSECNHLIRGAVGDDRVCDAPALEVFAERFDPGGVDFVGDEQAGGPIAEAIWVDLPPGDAARSSTVMPGASSAASATDIAEGSCK